MKGRYLINSFIHLYFPKDQRTGKSRNTLRAGGREV